MMDGAGAVVAKEVFELLQGTWNVGIPVSIDDVEVFLRMCVVKTQMMERLDLRCGSRTGAKSSEN